MHPNELLLDNFYSAFQRRDAAAMAACYADEVVFSDPVFPNLRGDEARSMWRMLCERGKDLSLTFDRVRADDASGSAHWEAAYTFSTTGRRVHNVIDAAFVFKAGRIIRHTDSFDLWKWAGMALGPRGQFLGWLPPVQGAIRQNVRRGLDAFMQKQGAGNA
jgi:ketosteroid isomerase-like protein